MDTDVQDSLEDLGYKGPLLEDVVFTRALDDGATSVEYTKLVEWVTIELSAFFGIEERVSAVTGPDDSDTFLMELSGFLREYGCPLVSLTEGPISQRLGSRENRVQLLDYLLTELSAARMLSVNKPDMMNTATEEVSTPESASAKDLKNICVTLGFPRPPEGITPFQLFTKVETKLKEIISATPSRLVGKPLLKARLSGKQWDSVEFINKALKQEYECRREMLLKRLDVTIQSFKWSDRVKSKDDQVAALFQPIRRNLSIKTDVGIPLMLAAREDLTQVQKTSSGAARERTKCAINRVKIGKVPDRGGRAYDHEIPPPEMPSFMKRSNAPQGQRDNRGGGGGRGDRGDRRGGGRGGGGGGSGGDRVQGGWGGSDRSNSASSQGSWGGGGGGGGGAAHYSQQQQSAGQAFFGGGGGGGGHQQGGYQQGGYQQQQGGYQGGYQQQGGQQQGGQQQGGYQQGGYQQGGYQQNQGGYQQGGYQDNSGSSRGGRGGSAGSGGRGGGRGRGRY